ncbi:serine peptidase [Peterkaempfera bronchialis]|uniref:serine peptidase n=1 Tax=Peterkaempfera bronchialis TaxID=2126346 RepID=UPI003C2C4413
MTDPTPVVAVHGIGNLQPGRAPAEAAALLAAQWQPRLAAGYTAAGLPHLPVPRLEVAYYAHLLAEPQAQGAWDGDLDELTGYQSVVAAAWLLAAGVPAPAEAQGPATLPLRQALGWLAARRGVAADTLGRVVVALAREVYVYLSRAERRRRIRDTVAEAVRTHRPRVVLAHSLGSVVAYEALHAHPDLEVDLLVTLGSPLGLPGAVFEALEPEPRDGRGARPPGVARWVNLADPGDLVALPPRLGGRFPVDRHEEAYIGRMDFHTLGGYLGSGLTATAMAAYAT